MHISVFLDAASDYVGNILDNMPAAQCY